MLESAESLSILYNKSHKENRMKSNLKAIVLLTGLALTGCATQSTNTFQPFQPTPIDITSGTVKYTQKTDNLLVIMDASSSKSAVYEGTEFPGQSEPTKFSVSRELLSRINKTIPDTIKLNAGIRSFGFGPCTSWQFTKQNLAVSPYSTSAFASGIDSLTCSSGGSPMHRALQEASTDLSATTGNNAVLIISAGYQLDTSPVPAAKALKAQYGDRLCIYTIWIGNEQDKPGRHLLQQLTNLGGCGFATSAADIASSPDMADFVERVLFTKGPAASSIKDTDGDGVPDYKDKCPNTPKGAIVDKDGCWAYHGVFFDFDKYDIKPEFHDLFQNAVKVMNLNPGLEVQIEGHTDSIGSVEYNQKLSDRRAQAVKDYMVNKGVSASRMTTKGFGESDPIADNHTEEGRAYNRRVEYEIIKR